MVDRVVMIDSRDVQVHLPKELRGARSSRREGPTMLGASMYLWVLADGDLPWGAERYVVWLAQRASLEYAPENRRIRTPTPILWG